MRGGVGASGRMNLGLQRKVYGIRTNSWEN